MHICKLIIVVTTCYPVCLTILDKGKRTTLIHNIVTTLTQQSIAHTHAIVIHSELNDNLLLRLVAERSLEGVISIYNHRALTPHRLPRGVCPAMLEVHNLQTSREVSLGKADAER